MPKHRVYAVGTALAVILIACSPAIREAKSQPLTSNVNSALGNPSNATSNDPQNTLVARPQFVLSHHQRNGGPNWVSWHLQRSDLGRTRRTNAFMPDPLLPSNARIRPSDYQGSGFDRGHQCPSGDRTGSRPNNEATFVMSNMLPQEADLNQRVWEGLESYCRDLVRRGNELYIICGGHGTRGTIAQGKVNIPLHCWKVIVVLPEGGNDLQRINNGTRVIAVDIPNADGIDNRTWRNFIVTIDMVEAATGFDFLSNLSEDMQSTLEAKLDTGREAPRRQRRTRGRNR
jgi:endonuclease G, mitochondrial